jgi:hypothetical protein
MSDHGGSGVLNQANPIVPLPHGNNTVDLSTCTGGTGLACGGTGCGTLGNCGTQIIICGVTPTITCLGDTPSVSFTVSAESTGSVSAADVWFYVDTPAGVGTPPLGAEKIGSVTNADWQKGSGRDKFAPNQPLTSVQLPPGNYSAHICMDQPGSNGRAEKCTCSEFTLVIPPCPGGGGGGAHDCVTRTAGFWCNHPSVTALFLPVSVCGDNLTAGPAGSCSVAVEALGSLGTDITSDPQRVQLTRQLTTAKLNINATAQTTQGSCGSGITTRIQECEGLLCACPRASNADLGSCISDLDAFNNSGESLSPPPFDNPPPAQPAQCKAAHDNTINAPCSLPTCN